MRHEGQNATSAHCTVSLHILIQMPPRKVWLVLIMKVIHAITEVVGRNFVAQSSEDGENDKKKDSANEE